MKEDISLSDEVRSVDPEVVSTRRDLHAHPELGYKERRTAGLVAERLRALGLVVHTGIAETGVLGILEGGRPGPVVLLRADMDALPIQEATGAAYASQVPGVMHACGHDGHTAILLGAARVLAAGRARLAGTVKFVFQPAEETFGGARRMVEWGVLRDPDVAAAFGLHVWNSLPLGTIGIVPGPAMAATDYFDLAVVGRGGHAAAPHEAVDPIVAAGHFIVAAQALVSRSTNPVLPAVFTIGSIHGGDRPNIIPQKVAMEATLRTFDPELRALLLRRIEETLRGITASFGAECVYDHHPGYPATVNDPAMARFAREQAEAIVGAERVVAPRPTMGGEDMAFYLQQVPGCYLWIGSSDRERGLVQPHHSPLFDFDERALGIGVEVLVRLTRGYLGRQ